MPRILADFPNYQEPTSGINQWGQDIGDATLLQDLPSAATLWEQYVAAGASVGPSRGDVWCYEPGSTAVQIAHTEHQGYSIWPWLTVAIALGLWLAYRRRRVLS